VEGVAGYLQYPAAPLSGSGWTSPEAPPAHSAVCGFLRALTHSGHNVPMLEKLRQMLIELLDL
jgi:hypothetical protein